MIGLIMFRQKFMPLIHIIIAAFSSQTSGQWSPRIDNLISSDRQSRRLRISSSFLRSSSRIFSRGRLVGADSLRFDLAAGLSCSLAGVNEAAISRQ